MKTQKIKNRLLTISAILGLAAGGISVASANDLFNGDLDIVGAQGANGQANAGPAGWNITAVESLNGSFDDGADSETWCDEDGGGYGLFLKPFQGSTNSNPALDNTLSVWFYQSNPCSAGTKETLSAYACGEANYSGYDTNVVNNGLSPYTGLYVEFLNASGQGIVTNTYDLVKAGLSNAGDPDPITQFTTPQFTAPAGTVSVIAGAEMLNVWGTSGSQSLLMDVFDLESVAPAGSPVITQQPTAATAPLGGNASFTVATSPAATTYTWSLNGNTISDGGEFSGSATATLKITGVSTNDVGHYQVSVANSLGSSFSQKVPLAVNGLNLFPTVSITGTIGDTYAIERSSSPSGPWTSFSTNKLSSSSVLYIVDYTLPVSPSEFYQAVFLY
jgi:hypothetical protein